MHRLVTQFLQKDRRVLSPEIGDHRMHGVLIRELVLHEVSVLASREEAGVNVEVFTAALVLRLI